MPITQQLKSDSVSIFHLKGHYREWVILRYSECILCNFDKVHQLFQMFSKKLLGCDVVRRGMATAPNWAEAVEANEVEAVHVASCWARPQAEPP